jgi:hypothetical protein
MAPYKRRPDPARSGPLGIVVQATKLNPPTATSRHPKQALLDELTEARQWIDQCAWANAVIAGWRDELRDRIQRQQLVFMFVDCGAGLSAEEYDERLARLKAEIDEYKRVIACLTSRRRP